ncbi:hypothetical protein IWX76_000073 [Pedobacter sp. CAN_A7]|uniref:DUF6266 family protein n=1 Tax=Pedobacter sp. CAN_A7 TaxID=2787722 RepID=UPI0018CAA6C2
MAILKQGLFGPVTGKIGNLVTATWKGINYVRQAPHKSNKPPTAAQLAIREKFKFVHKLNKPLNPFFKAGFNELAIHKSELNVAFARTSDRVVSGTYPDLQVDLSELTISAGRLSQLDEVEITQTVSQVLAISWSVEYWKSNCAYDDQVMVAILCPEIELADGFIGATERSDLHCTINFSSKFIGKEIAVYIGLYSLNRRMASHSQFLGKFIAL